MSRASKLTTAEPGHPPMTVNSAHVARIRPRVRPVPNTASQGGGLTTRFDGASIHFVDGSHVNVTEEYDEVHERLFGSEYHRPQSGQTELPTEALETFTSEAPEVVTPLIEEYGDNTQEEISPADHLDAPSAPPAKRPYKRKNQTSEQETTD